MKYSNGYERYNRPVYEIVKAASKHIEAAIFLKEHSEKQKIRIQEYKQQIDKHDFKI